MRTTEQKLALYRRYFTGRMDVHGTYDVKTQRGRSVKEPVTEQVLLAHLQGKTPYGLYLLHEDQTPAIVADFDADDLDGPMRFVTAAKGYGLPAYIERSKRKGYHAWVFFEEGGVLAAKARLVVFHVLDEISLPRTEVFPMQDRLGAGIAYGNYINAPLFGRLVPEGRTVFVDPADPTKPAANQWDLLSQIRTVQESTLDEIIDVNDLKKPFTSDPHGVGIDDAGREHWFALPPCSRRMLVDGVSAFQRVACFRIAVQMKKAGLPQDLAAACLQAWAPRNRPSDGKGIITEPEVVDQVRWAYGGGYRSCGCAHPVVMPYCDPSCPVKTPKCGPPKGGHSPDGKEEQRSS